MLIPSTPGLWIWFWGQQLEKEGETDLSCSNRSSTESRAAVTEWCSCPVTLSRRAVSPQPRAPAAPGTDPAQALSPGHLTGHSLHCPGVCPTRAASREPFPPSPDWLTAPLISFMWETDWTPSHKRRGYWTTLTGKIYTDPLKQSKKN